MLERYREELHARRVCDNDPMKESDQALLDQIVQIDVAVIYDVAH